MKTFGIALLALAFLASLASPVAAQKKDAKVDPYTGGDPAAIRDAGYVDLGPFAWSREVERALPEIQIRWVETAHFHIGLALAEISMPGASRTRRKVVAELKALKSRLPKVNLRCRMIDPWLRLHLYAFRLEKLYDEMQGILGVVDLSFAKGKGPYLGMGGKYRVLLLKTGRDLKAYRSAVTDRPVTNSLQPFRHTFTKSDSILYAACAESEKEHPQPGHALHIQALFNMCQNLLNGYKHYDFNLPAWIAEGLGNSFVRALDPKEFQLSEIKFSADRSTRNTRWAVNARRLVKNGLAPRATQLCMIESAAEFSLNDHICSWARVDFLRQLGEGKGLARFLDLLKTPLPRLPGKPPPFAEVLQAQERAFGKAFGMSWEEFDNAWTKYVLKKHPR